MVLVGHGNFQIPFYWEMLENNSGNSNSINRIDLLVKVFKIVDKRRIGLVVADREFMGHKWLKWLKDQHLNFCFKNITILSMNMMAFGNSYTEIGRAHV